jgi:hypothetical protein
MIQKNIRDWGGIPYTNAEADELTQELNDRTASSQDGYNSVDELATKVKAAENNINDKEDAANKGVANGYAELDSTGKVPPAQLPAGVDEVQEYADLASFPATGSASVIYVAIDTNKTYRWGGTIYVEIAAGSLVLGETSTTAYRGDRGKIAYDHSQTAHAPADAEANQTNAEIKAQYEANADTNAFTDAWQTKLSQIEANATADQVASEVPFTPAGNTTASNVQLAIQEVQTELDGVRFDTDTNTSDIAGKAGLADNNTMSGINTFTNVNQFEGATTFKSTAVVVNGTNNAGVGGQFSVGMGDGYTSTFVGDGANSKLTLSVPDGGGNDESYVFKYGGATATDDIARFQDITINSKVSGEPTGSDQVLNVVSLTQAEYDAGSPNATTFYVITDA